MGRSCNTHAEAEKYVHKILVGKFQGKALLGVPKRGWEDDIKVNRREIICRAWIRFNWLRIGSNGRLS
jgi:hypothetical protein